jgi:hypothetical protein
MFGFALALTASSMAVEATGMEPQLRVIRQAAAERSWPITCEGHAGEEGVVRVGIPLGTSRAAVDDFIETVRPVASSVGNLGVDPTKQSCDREPISGGSSAPVRNLIFTTGERDPRLLTVARQCGFWSARWRPTTPEDVLKVGGRLDAKKYPTTLDAGEDVTTRYGPMICFLNMRPHLPHVLNR